MRKKSPNLKIEQKVKPADNLQTPKIEEMKHEELKVPEQKISGTSRKYKHPKSRVSSNLSGLIGPGRLISSSSNSIG